MFSGMNQIRLEWAVQCQGNVKGKNTNEKETFKVVYLSV